MEELDNNIKLEISYKDGKVEKISVQFWEIEDCVLKYWVDTYDYENSVIQLGTMIPLLEISKVKEVQ